MIIAIILRSIIDNKQCGERPGNPCGSGRPSCECPDGQSFRFCQHLIFVFGHGKQTASVPMDSVWRLICIIIIFHQMSVLVKWWPITMFDHIFCFHIIISCSYHHHTLPTYHYHASVLKDSLSGFRVPQVKKSYTKLFSPRELRTLLRELAQG